MDEKRNGRNRLTRWLNRKKSRQNIQIINDFFQPPISDIPPLPTQVPPLTPFEQHREKYKHLHANIDSQTGEHMDYTTIWHSLSLQDQADLNEAISEGPERPPGEPSVLSLGQLWLMVAEYLDPKTAACLALTNKFLYSLLNSHLQELDNPENYKYKLAFLVLLDKYYPYHLLCVPCAKYHYRTKIGQEKLLATKANPLFQCPNEFNDLNPQPRLQIAQGRTLPYTFVQLATRARRFEPYYGISTESLSRRWTRDEWTHSTRFHIYQGRLLMRVVSQCFVPPGLTESGKRLILYSPGDYCAYFSVCSHWRDGELMNVAKCALDHLPVPRSSAGFQGVQNKFSDSIHGRTYNPHAMPRQCNKCTPVRRCPLCPTEYLIEVKLTEDKTNDRSKKYELLTTSSNNTHNLSKKDKKEVALTTFRYALIVTRWSDLGDGRNCLGDPPDCFPPASMEWAACNGKTEDYDSMKMAGKRGLSGIFEAAFTHDTVPGRRMVSMNPDNKKGGEERNDWY